MLLCAYGAFLVPHVTMVALTGLRVENQLGYKMVKWIKSIEFVTSEASVGKGYGGKNEDDENYPVVADI